VITRVLACDNYPGNGANAINLTDSLVMARATRVTEGGVHLHSEMASDMC